VKGKHAGTRDGMAVHFMYDDVETVEAKKKARMQDCSTIFRRASKPLTKSGLEPPFLMLPDASYGGVCVHIRAMHTDKRAAPRRQRKTSRARDRLFLAADSAENH